MRLLSRKEELILLAIWTLQDNAYGVTIREHIEKVTGVQWLFGAIYNPLGRLVEMGLVASLEAEPLPERGGRRKTLYKLTQAGRGELERLRELQTAMWAQVPPLTEEG